MSTLRRALAGVGLGAIAVGPAASSAAAVAADPGRQPARPHAPSFSHGVSPQEVQPGGAVELTVTGCTKHEAFAESALFERIGLGMPGEIQSAQTMIDTDARVGARYEVVFTCGEETGTSVLTIVEGGASPTATPTPTPTSTASPTVAPTVAPTATTTTTAAPTASATSKPSLGAQAGVGGSQHGSFGGVAPVAAAAGVAALALAGGALALRRRPGGSRHD